MRFFGHRRWLRATAYVFTLSTGIVRFLLRGNLGVNPYRDCAEIVQKSCNVSAVAVQSLHLYGACAGIGLRTDTVRGLCNTTYDMSTGYGLTIFSNLLIRAKKQWAPAIFSTAILLGTNIPWVGREKNPLGDTLYLCK